MGWDKPYHAGAYALLHFSFLHAFSGFLPAATLGHQLRAFVAASCFGIFDELHQMFVPGRECSLSDLGADLVGILLSWALAFGIVQWWTKRKRRGKG